MRSGMGCYQYRQSQVYSLYLLYYYLLLSCYYLLTSFLLCRMATQFLAATTLRNAIGTKKLPELLKDRPAVSYMVFQHMMHYAREWGIEVVRVEM